MVLNPTSLVWLTSNLALCFNNLFFASEVANKSSASCKYNLPALKTNFLLIIAEVDFIGISNFDLDSPLPGADTPTV